MQILRYLDKLKMKRTHLVTKARLEKKGEALVKKRSTLTRDFKHTSTFKRQLKKSQRKRAVLLTSAIPTL